MKYHNRGDRRLRNIGGNGVAAALVSGNGTSALI
jgi:hypothetical protein